MPRQPMGIDSVSVHTVVTMSTVGSIRNAYWGLAESFLNEKAVLQERGEMRTRLGAMPMFACEFWPFSLG